MSTGAGRVPQHLPWAEGENAMRQGPTGFLCLGALLGLMTSAALAQRPPTHLPPPTPEVVEPEPQEEPGRPVVREPLFLSPSALMTGTVQQSPSPLVPVPPGLRPYAEHAGPFEAGTWSVEAIGGYGEKTDLGPVVPGPFEFAVLRLRLGYMLTSPSDCGVLLDGNCEALFDVTVAPVSSGFADVIAGPSLLLRYNLVRPWCCLVPYVQAGAGLVYSDGHQDQFQEALGREWEWMLSLGAGLRFQLDDNWSLDATLDFHHLSNGGRARRNAGLNVFTGGLGLRYTFPSCQRKCRE